MSAIARMIESVQRIDALLRDPDLEPSPERDDWPSVKSKVEALRGALTDEIAPQLPAALAEAEGTELATMIRRRTAHLHADAAAVLHAAGDAMRGGELLARAERGAPDKDHRAELAAAQSEPAVFTRLVLARWLLQEGRFAGADREAKRVRRETKQRPLADAANKVLRSPRPLTGGAPSLSTFNGVGVGLYGRRDVDVQGTYVATHCVCVLFIPIFPLAAYRVRRVGPSSYEFLAKEALSSFARGVRIAVSLAVALGLGGAALNGYLTSDEHRSQVALQEAREAEDKGRSDEAMGRYRGIVEGFPAELAEVKEASRGVTRLAAKEIPSPCTVASAESVRRAANAFLALAEPRREVAQPAELLERLVTCAKEIGDADTRSAQAALRILDMAAEVARGTEHLASIQAQRAAARRAFAAKVAPSRPLLALSELAQLDDPAAVTAAAKIIGDLGPGPSLWVEAGPDIERWSRHAHGIDDSAAGEALAKLSGARTRHQEISALLAAGEGKAIEKAAAEQPENQELAVAVAARKRAGGDVKGALALLSGLGPPGRLTAATQEALADAHSDASDLARADEILTALLDERLPAFQETQRVYFAAVDAAQQRISADLQRGNVPPDLENRVAAAVDDARKREELQAWVSSRIEKDPALIGVRAEYLRRGAVVSTALSLGLVKLRRAAEVRGAEREGLLSQAESAFLAIRNEASGDPSFHLALAQVYFRLGKSEEGEKEIQSVLDRGEPPLSLAVARIYRELGMYSRARKVAREVHDKASDAAARHSAASLLAHLAVDLEDEEAWLRKSDLDDPTVRIGLDRIEGERLLRAGKLVEADQKFRKCAEHFARSATTNPVDANNAATETLRRYSATGDRAHLEAAVRYLEGAARLQQDNALILGNLSDALDHLGYVTVLSKWVDTRALILSPSAARALASSMIDGPLSAELLDALGRDPSFQRALEIRRKQQILAPQMPGAYRLHLRWYGWTSDVKALEDLRKRVELLPSTAGDPEMDEQWRSGERDEAAAKEAKAHVSMARRQVGQVKSGSKPTQAAAWMMLSDALLSAVFFEPDGAALDEAAEAIRNARAAWPEGVTGRDAGATLFGVAFLRAMDSAPALKKAWAEGRRKHSTLVLAHLAAGGAGGAEVLAALRKEPTFVESIALLKTSMAVRPSLRDFLLARLASDSELEQAAAKGFDRRESELGHAIERKLEPDNEEIRVLFDLFRSRGAPR